MVVVNQSNLGLLYIYNWYDLGYANLDKNYKIYVFIMLNITLKLVFCVLYR